MSHEVKCRARASRAKMPPMIAGVLALFLVATGCAERDGETTAARSDSDGQPSSRELYLDHCASCHGTEGRGDGPLAAELQVTPINLRLLKKENDGRFPTQKVQRSIDGRGMPRAHGLPDMPVWGKRWLRQGQTEADVQARAIAITSYIGSIQE